MNDIKTFTNIFDENKLADPEIVNMINAQLERLKRANYKILYSGFVTVDKAVKSADGYIIKELLQQTIIMEVKDGE